MRQAGTIELLERAAEAEAIDAALAAAADGRGRFVLIEGASGLGKTSLLALAGERAEPGGFRVLAATGQDLEEGHPWGVVTQLFDETARDGDADRLFSGAAALALPLLQPGEAAPAPGPAAAADAFPLLHGLYWLTAGLCSEQPLLLLVDDVHWSDLETLRFLNYLQPRIGELRALVIAAVRPGDRVEERAAGLLARLGAHPEVSAFRLQPLSGPSVRRLVRRALPAADDSFCDAIGHASGGNPFLARELAAAAHAEGLAGTAASAGGLRQLRPEAIRNMILVRLAMLGTEASRVAAAVAILGPAASPELVRTFTGLEGDTATSAADALAAAGILVPGERLSFAHPIVREVVYADLPPLWRRQQHEAAARLLQRRGAPPGQVAGHLEAADPVMEPWAVSALREAAVAAMRKSAPERAARLLRRALETLGDRADPELVLETGLAELSAAEPAAIAHLEAAAAMLRDGPRAVALGGLAQARYVRGETAAAVALAREALDGIAFGRGGRLEAELLLQLALAARPVPEEIADLRRLLQRPRPSERGRPSPAETVRRLSLAFDAMLRGRRSVAREAVYGALTDLDAPSAAEQLPQYTRGWAALNLAFVGEYADAERLIGPALDAAWRRASRVEIAQLLETRAFVHFRRGEVSACLADSESLLGLHEDGWELATIPVRCVRAAMLVERDELELATSMLEVPDEVERRLPGTWAGVVLPWGRAVLAAASGSWSESLEQALKAGEGALAIEAPSPDYIEWRSLAARAAAHLGDREQAEYLVAEELELARAAGSPRATGIALATKGALARGREAVSILADAVEELDRADALLEGARARLQLGIALRHARRPRDARVPLREALDRTGRLGSIALARQARAELLSTGARPRRPALTGVQSLTPSERRVVEFVAGGLSNTEVAQALFITVRTVETHLTHAYAKLGISSRIELPGALAGEAPADGSPPTEAARAPTRAGSSR